MRRFNGSDENHFFPCTSNRNVQAPFSPSLVQGSKIQCHLTPRVTPVANAENHYVAFVTLDILKIFHEETFQPVFFEEMLEFRLFSYATFNRFLHGFHLSYAECDDSESFLWIFLEVFKNQISDGFGFHRIIS